MALHFSGTDYISSPTAAGAVSLWMRTTQATGGPVEICGKHNATSGSYQGWGLTLTPTTGRLGLFGTFGASTAFSIAGTKVVNDGLWHHVGVNLWFASGANRQNVYVDGVLDMQGASAGVWGGTSQPLRVGKSNDPFWVGFIGDIAEFATWSGPGLLGTFNADQFKALSLGFRPPSVCLFETRCYMPLVANVNDLWGRDGNSTLTGGSFVNHDLRIFP